MGYFFSFAAMVITIYWIYRGLRRELYADPRLNIFFALYVPLLIARVIKRLTSVKELLRVTR
jgi:hypothetical protein